MNFNLPPDPWDVLQIPPGNIVDKDAVRRKYLRLVLKCHPDKVADNQKEWAEKEFPRVQQAYELLMDDAALGKYLETRRKQEQWAKAAAAAQTVSVQPASPSANMPNTSAVRTPPREFTTYKPRTAEQKATTRTTRSGGTTTTTTATSATTTIPGIRTKVYTYTTSAHSRSQEEMQPSDKTYTAFVMDDLDDTKGPRRSASYEDTATHTGTRRDEKRRKEKGERLDKEYFQAAQQRREKRDRKERDGADLKETRDAARDVLREELASRKTEKKMRERERERIKEERDRDRKRDADDKRRQNKSPYVEPYEGEEDREDNNAAPKPDREKKTRPGGGSKKHDEARPERDRSASRRNRSPAPPAEAAQTDKIDDLFKFAASYMSGRGTNLASRPSPMQGADNLYAGPPEAPTPPNGFEEDEGIRVATARAAGRRASRTSKSSREKMSREYDVDAEPPIERTRTIPSLSKSTSSPPNLSTGNSPPRLSRATTMPPETVPLSSSYTPIPPAFSRTQTWGGADERIRSSAPAPEYFEGQSDDDRPTPTIPTRRSGRRGSNRGESTVRYKVQSSYKTSRMDYAGVDPAATYGVSGTSPSARRYRDTEMPAGYAGAPFASVKQSRHFDEYDVKYSDANVSYSTMPRDPTYAAYPVAS